MKIRKFVGGTKVENANLEKTATIQTTINRGRPFRPRLSEAEPINYSKMLKEYAAYSQNQLMKSGDIETEPGPNKPHTHILEVIILLLLLLMVNTLKETDDQPQWITNTSLNNIKRSLNLIRHILSLNNKRRWRKINIKNREAYLLILLIIKQV